MAARLGPVRSCMKALALRSSQIMIGRSNSGSNHGSATRAIRIAGW